MQVLDQTSILGNLNNEYTYCLLNHEYTSAIVTSSSLHVIILAIHLALLSVRLTCGRSIL